MEEGLRIRSFTVNEPWVWSDHEACGAERGVEFQNNNSEHILSSMTTCYFPRSELVCPQDKETPFRFSDIRNVSDPRYVRCRKMRYYKKSDWRAATTEFLFSPVSEVVVKEAERQLRLVFPDGVVPKDLITVHIRWGDKVYENPNHSVQDYFSFVEEIKRMRGDKNGTTTNIFLATEDPKAVSEFTRLLPSTWKLYIDQFYHDLLPHRGNKIEYNMVPKASQSMKGKGGLLSLGSLLVAMEASAFVLTRASNWSRLIDELRKNILDLRCGNCTFMVDISRKDPKYEEW
eukprot:CAMPEP_0116823046 /NCGR_PEP_ID=MMETSP0418-20121206/619_1 /TAXON_ID=1158023 /ORGANISM="Astrosyne radiata, Strain 13vi08-1A" /LENGTH=287 /DNA_ID=CAMNT_0004451253 /DNA_START=249 /DNA_END=1112 /DNA_ORIENTATION=+